MKMKLLSQILTVLIICICCFGCKSSTSVEGTWYSVTDTTMYKFDGGKITVAGAVVGQYESENDSVILSMIDNKNNLKLYATVLDGVDVLADVREGDGNIYFCKGLANAEKIIAQNKQRKEDMMREFSEYVNNNIFGKWIPIKKEAEYKSITISPDGIIVFIDKDDEASIKYLVADDDGDCKITDLRMENRGYDSPAMTVYMANLQGKDISEMAIWACEETYREEYPALGFYGWTYKKEK